MKKDIPENCTCCRYRIACKSWYGGTGCKYKDTIAKIRKEG